MQGGEIVPVPPVTWSERFPELERLFATHFVEDWRCLYPGPAEAIRGGINDRSLDELRVVLTELNDLLALRLGEPELRDVLSYDLGSYYIPASRTCTDWLEEVVGQLHESVKARTAEARSPGAVDDEP
jgi:hypothetical protein